MGVSYQIAPDIITSYRVETTANTLAPNDSTARRFRTNAGSGIKLSKGTIPSGEIRQDLMTVRPRHGQRTAAGSLACDLSLSSVDPLLEASLRGTFSAPLTSAAFAATYDSATGIFGRGTGSFIGEGFRVGDVVVPTGGANAGIPAILVAVGTTAATVGNKSAWVNQTAVAGVTVTRPKKVIQPASPVLRTFSVEHWMPTTQISERYFGGRIGTLAFAQPPEGMVTTEFGMTFLDRVAPLPTTRYFSSATEYTTPGYAVADAVVCFNGSVVTTLQAMSLSMNLQLSAPPVVGSRVAPNAWDGVATMAGQLSFMRTSNANLAAFDSETVFSLQVMYREVGSNNFTALCIPEFTFGAADPDNKIAASGPQIEVCDMIIGRASASDRDASMITICTSAA